MATIYYTDLGNLSAVEFWWNVRLHCDVCRIQWIGCADAAACPQCDNTEAWDKITNEKLLI